MASGQTVAACAFPYGYPDLTNPAEPGRTAANIPYVAFDDGTSESWYVMLPARGDYDGSASLKVILPWKFTTFVGSQTCKWDVAVLRLNSGGPDMESPTFAAAQSVTDTEAGSAGRPKYAEITFTNAQFDGVQGGEWFVLKITRDAAGGTASPGDAELSGVTVEEA